MPSWIVPKSHSPKDLHNLRGTLWPALHLAVIEGNRVCTIGTEASFKAVSMSAGLIIAVLPKAGE